MNWLQDILNRIERLLTWWIVVNPWESAVRVTFGKKMRVLAPGMWFKIPFVHNVRVQSVRLRVITCGLQTVTSKDGTTITVRLVIGFSIEDIAKLYNSLDSPDLTMANFAMGETADLIARRTTNECKPETIQDMVKSKLTEQSYGLKLEYVKVTNFAIVRTYRLMGDHHWNEGNLNMESDNNQHPR